MRIKINKTILGYLFALIASIALANSFIFSKLSFKELSFYQFGFYWFFLGTLWNLIYVFFRKKRFFSLTELSLSINSSVIYIAVLEAIATGLFYYAILIMENPGVVSFIGNIGPVFVVLLGLVFLKEAFNKIQFVGILLAVGGVFLINFKGLNSVGDIFLAGSEYVILASFLFALAAIIARRKRNKFDVGILSLFRAIILLVVFLVLNYSHNQISLISIESFIYVSLGSFLEVFITIIFAYKSLQYIQAFKTSIIISSKGVFAIISAWIFLFLEPKLLEILGGIISIAGVFLVSFQKVKN
ncbi:MAG: DMT family transporter [Bacteroidales bacterium]|nr:DMT family transporter [Bacteroidales bacterium]MBN2758669.1 DMT family transporter [Bacteroidales bacterium]